LLDIGWGWHCWDQTKLIAGHSPRLSWRH
jgi:hypothetical protein